MGVSLAVIAILVVIARAGRPPAMIMKSIAAKYDEFSKCGKLECVCSG